MYRNYGGDWVGNQVAREVVDGGAAFVVNSGDVVWWGGQGKTLEDSPYWQRMNRLLLSKLPPVDDEMRAAGLEGRYFPSVGNHEVWEDPQIEGVLSAAPYLAKLGVSSEKLIYTYDFRDTRFIFLWTGKADRFAPSGWDATRPVYQEQLAQLVAWLDDAKAKGIRNVFVVFHNPVYNRSGFEPIPEDTNPHATLASYAKDFAELVVFNGHVHTTETFDVDGVKYVVMGGGGAEQDPILPGRTAIPRPDGYPQDLYWQGQPPKEEYNYLVVEVTPGKPSVFRLNRFRPWSSTPFEEVKLFETGN
ncbi:metallophosphoesterase family protein [Rhizobium ruizarguesonis]|nr:metallophosphoesterase [Rhizobium ruizarguesonis]